MAIAEVSGQKAGSVGGGSISDATFANPVTSGNYLLFCFCLYRSSAVPILNTPTKLSGTATIGSWVLDHSYSNTSGADNLLVAVYRTIVTGTGTITLRATGTFGGNVAVINEYSGMAESLDGSPTNVVGTSDTESTGNITKSVPGMIVMVSCELSSAPFTYTLSGSSVEVYQSEDSASTTGQVSHKISSSGSHTLTASTGNSWFWVAIGVPYSDAGAEPHSNYIKTPLRLRPRPFAPGIAR
jgi:hypothetical protein